MVDDDNFLALLGLVALGGLFYSLLRWVYWRGLRRGAALGMKLTMAEMMPILVAYRQMALKALEPVKED